MSSLPILLGFFVALGSLTAARAQTLDPVVEKLGEDLEAKVTFLIPEDLAFPPGEVKPSRKIPLVIHFHGAGGVGDDARKGASRARVLIKGLHQFKKGPCLVVAPQ